MYSLLILCKSRVFVHGFFYVKQRNMFPKYQITYSLRTE